MGYGHVSIFMNKVKYCALGLCLLLTATPWGTQAAERKGKVKRINAVLAKYDTNHNGFIDGKEMDAIRKAYAADPDGELSEYDTNHDRKLSDAEIALIRSSDIKPVRTGGKNRDKEKATAPVENDPNEQ